MRHFTENEQKLIEESIAPMTQEDRAFYMSIHRERPYFCKVPYGALLNREELESPRTRNTFVHESGSKFRVYLLRVIPRPEEKIKLAEAEKGIRGWANLHVDKRERKKSFDVCSHDLDKILLLSGHTEAVRLPKSQVTQYLILWISGVCNSYPQN